MITQNRTNLAGDSPVHAGCVSNMTMPRIVAEKTRTVGPSLGNVSVIVPALNAASTLAESLESVISQTYPDWELLVIDDGSSDATLEIASDYARRDPRIRVISQTNGGESAARNTGIAQARYDWLVFLDSDDWIASTHLEKLATELAAHPDLDAVHCGSVRVTGDGTEIRDDYQPPTGDLFPVLARRAAFPVHACMVRKSIVEAVGKLDTSLKTCPDWDLWQRIARAGARFGAVREVLAYYRVRPNSSSSRAEQLFRDGLTVLQRGHAPDQRVPHPLPEYANGLSGDTVESQVFYLLCWGAGLMLGSGQDARELLDHVRDFHYPALYPDAVAQCILEAGTLPASEPREAWERLFPASCRNVERFLEALEAQAQAPGLAAAALQKLKRMILKHSALWKSVIEEDEGEAGERQEHERQLAREAQEQRERVNALDSRLQELSADRERILSAIHLHEEKTALQRDLDSAHRREKEIVGQLVQSRGTEAALREELDRARQRENALHLELQEARLQHSVFEREMEASQKLHALWQREMEDAREQHVLFEAELSDAMRRHALFSQELDEARRQHSYFERESDAARERESALEAKLHAGRERESALQTENAVLSGELDSLAAVLDDLQAQVADLALAKTSAETELLRLQTSGWSKLGLKLGLTKPAGPRERPHRHPVPAPGEFTAPAPPDWKWQLRTGPRSSAEIHVAASDPETFRVVIARAVNQTRWDIQLNRSGLHLQPHHRYTLQFRARADRARTVLVGVAKGDEPWSNLGLSEELLLHSEWQEFREEFTIETQETNARIHLDLGGRKTAVEFSDFQVYDQDGRRLSI
jgi:hypothetical protein